MNQDPFASLSPQELGELSLCGIATEDQFYNCNVESLLRDLAQAQQFFPEKQFILTEERVLTIFRTVRKQEPSTPESQKLPSLPGGLTKGQALPTSTLHHQNHYDEETESFSKMASDITNLHTSVRSLRPFLSVCAAISTLLLIVSPISLLAIPVLLIVQEDTTTPELVILAALGIISMLPFLILSRLAKCPVCLMNIFTFRNYTRSKAARCIPLLGYNITTALHMIFCAKYICQACGTPVRFFQGSRHHKKS